MISLLLEEFVCKDPKKKKHYKAWSTVVEAKSWLVGCDAMTLVALRKPKDYFMSFMEMDAAKLNNELMSHILDESQHRGMKVSRDLLEVFCGPHRTYDEAGEDFVPPERLGSIIKFDYDLRRLAKILHFMPPCPEVKIHDYLGNLIIHSIDAEEDWRGAIANTHCDWTEKKRRTELRVFPT